METEPKLEIAGQTSQCRNEATPVMLRTEHLNMQVEAEVCKISARDCREGKVKDENWVVGRSRLLVIFRREAARKAEKFRNCAIESFSL